MCSKRCCRLEFAWDCEGKRESRSKIMMAAPTFKPKPSFPCIKSHVTVKNPTLTYIWVINLVDGGRISRCSRCLSSENEEQKIINGQIRVEWQILAGSGAPSRWPISPGSCETGLFALRVGHRRRRRRHWIIQAPTPSPSHTPVGVGKGVTWRDKTKVTSHDTPTTLICTWSEHGLNVNCMHPVSLQWSVRLASKGQPSPGIVVCTAIDKRSICAQGWTSLPL